MLAITRRVRIGLAATILAALPALAFAHPGQGSDTPAGPGSVHAGERVKKGKLRKARLLAKFDINGNGKLDQPERAEALRVKIDKVIARLDTDGSGTLSHAEAAIRPRSRLARKFVEIDANGNGVLSKGEIRAARVVKLMRGKGKGKGKGKGRRGQRHGRQLAPV